MQHHWPPCPRIRCFVLLGSSGAAYETLWAASRACSTGGFCRTVRRSHPHVPPAVLRRCEVVTRGKKPMSQNPELLRRLLRAKDRMDAASHEEWPVRRLAQVSAV